MTQTQPVTFRPIAPDDLDRLRRFGCGLSPQTRYRRFLSGLRRLPEPTLRRLVEVDHVDREAVVALVGEELVGVARYERAAHDSGVADVAVVLADAWQGQGLGPRLLEALLERAARNGVRRLHATVLADNEPVRRLLRRRWPAVRPRWDGPLLDYELPLPVAGGAVAAA